MRREGHGGVKRGLVVDAVCQRKKKRAGRDSAMRDSCLWEGFRWYSEGLRVGAQQNQKQDGPSFRQ